MATAVGHRIGRDEIIWAFGPGLEPVLEVDPGETVTFETNDCFTGQITSEDDLVTEIDFERVNSATGPVAVRGAEPGDSLIAEVLDVRPIEFGFACLIPGFGQLIDEVQSPVTRMFRVEDGWIEMNERVRFPAKPMVGVVGVATDRDTLTNGLAGRHGGNLDDHLHGKGARLYFPVRQEGGMFAVGDMHASMGDGEICFTGVEISGEVTIRVSLLKGKQGTWPVTELADRWVVHGTAGQDFMEALDRASEEGARFLEQIGVERAGESAVGGQDDYRRLLRLGRLPQQRKTLGQLRRVEIRDDFRERIGVRTRGHDAILRALHLGGGNHLHGARDLARVLDGLDPSLQLASLGHSPYALAGLNF